MPEIAGVKIAENGDDIEGADDIHERQNWQQDTKRERDGGDDDEKV